MKKIITLIIAIILGLSSISLPAFAESCTCNSGGTGVVTNILGEDGVDSAGRPVTCKCDDGKGSSIMDILNLVVDIMTIGIGILGVIGISIVGIQYLTAGGSEEKTRKAKRRLFEIIIGLAAYAVIYALLKWLGLQPN